MVRIVQSVFEVGQRERLVNRANKIYRIVRPREKLSKYLMSFDPSLATEVDTDTAYRKRQNQRQDYLIDDRKSSDRNSLVMIDFGRRRSNGERRMSDRSRSGLEALQRFFETTVKLSSCRKAETQSVCWGLTRKGGKTQIGLQMVSGFDARYRFW